MFRIELINRHTIDAANHLSHMRKGDSGSDAVFCENVFSKKYFREKWDADSSVLF